MIRVTQRTGKDCFRTCIECIFEVDYDSLPSKTPVEVPHDLYFGPWAEWLEGRLLIPYYSVYAPDGYSVGVVGRPGYAHGVVCYDGKIVWDVANNLQNYAREVRAHVWFAND